MEKSELESLIQKRAEQRLETVMSNFAKNVSADPILRNLRLKFGEEEKDFMNSHGQTGSVLFNGSKEKDAVEISNIKEVKDKLLQEYIKEETEGILNKLDGLKYLFLPATGE